MPLASGSRFGSFDVIAPFGVEPTDRATIAAVVATIALVATIACGLPAFRASRLDPNVVLRTRLGCGTWR